MALTAKQEVQRVPVRHRACGSLLGWYTGAPDNNVVRSQDFVRLDGSQPEFGELVRENCPKCGPVAGAMKRCFDEVA